MISVAYTNTSAAPGIWNVSAIASNANGTAMQTWWWTVLANTTAAEQLYVNESGWWRDGGAFNANDTPIQAAIDAADSGNSIFVYNGTYYEGGGVSITKERLTLQGEDANTTIIHGRWTAEKVVYVTGDYVNVSGFTVTGSTSRGYGIYVNADYCTISDNNASESRCGIYLRYSSNCTLENNIASSNENYGIGLGSSSNCVITNNTASNENSGICLSSSSNCVLTNNTASSNHGNDGICLSSSSSNNTITGNNVSNNWNGIRLTSTSINNNIKENTISGNTNYGMYLDWAGDNEIYHNNFIDNNKQAYDHHGFNEWDKGSIIGGNYWSDHSCSGNPSDGTEPYTGIDTNVGAVDNYPFEYPDGWVSIIMNLHNISYEQTYIYWTWTDPADESFSKVMVYLDGIFKANVTKGVQSYNATGLAPDTEHTLSTRTVDTAGNIDESWINHSARTKPIPDTTPPFITDITTTTPTTDSVIIIWNTDEDSNSLAKYGMVSGVYTNTESDAEMVTSHFITLSGLSRNTSYYFVVNSTDASDNSDESVEYNFTTLKRAEQIVVINDWTLPSTGTRGTCINANVNITNTGNETIWFVVFVSGTQDVTGYPIMGLSMVKLDVEESIDVWIMIPVPTTTDVGDYKLVPVVYKLGDFPAGDPRAIDSWKSVTIS